MNIRYQKEKTSFQIMVFPLFHVVHPIFKIDVVYQVMIGKDKEDKLVIDDSSFCDYQDLIVDGMEVPIEMTSKWFSDMKVIGLNYEDEMCDEIERIIKMTDLKLLLESLNIG